MLVAGLAIAAPAGAGKTKKKVETKVEITDYAATHVNGVVDSKNAKCVGGRQVTVDPADAEGNPDPFPSSIPGDTTSSKGEFAITRGPSGGGLFPKLLITIEGEKAGKVTCKPASVVVG
jgi:hypothetical protein